MCGLKEQQVCVTPKGVSCTDRNRDGSSSELWARMEAKAVSKEAETDNAQEHQKTACGIHNTKAD